MKVDIEEYLNLLVEELLDETLRKDIILSRDWAQTAPNKAGVYALFEDDRLVYSGETGSIQGRMYDLLNDQHHQVRRNVGEKHYAEIDGFEKASSFRKFPPHITELVNSHIQKRMKVAYLPVSLGRKELEERLITHHMEKEYILNKRSKRKK